MKQGVDENPVIVFDGDCVLCSASAQFVLRHDRAARFRLAALQTPAGAALASLYGIDPLDPQSIILVRGGRALTDSDAVLAIGQGLGWPWKAVGALRIVPRPVRDLVYRFIARNRYRLFGRRQGCFVPAPDHRGRIL
ncbi:thiol-disulfide oxidoreductase DCC family protein [Allorhizobium pseudoryzae]|uniref:thiol-disulfide oxidoreductase DCC family protein n=1 Tax=Allorhizobium pseudoryzae TaxID=379684 RepID=UPI003CFFA44E